MISEVDTLRVVDRFDATPDAAYSCNQTGKNDDDTCRDIRKQCLHQISNSDQTGQWSEGFSMARIS